MPSSYSRTVVGLARWRVAATSAVLLAAMTGCGKPPAESAPPVAAPQTPAVAVVKPQRGTVQYTIKQPGYNIEAFQQTPVYAKVAGYVAKVNFDIGDRVHKGEVLAELSVPEMHVELRQKEALVRQAEAEVRQARESASAAAASLRSGEAKVKEAEVGRLRSQAEIKRTRGQYERLARVGRNGVLDQEAVEETQYGFEAATAGLAEVEARVKSAAAARDEAQARRDKARADVTVADEHLGVARENRDLVKTLLGYTQLRAPFDGVVTRRYVDVGHFVQPAASGSSKGEPLFAVEQTDPVRVFVNVPELEAHLIRKGAPVVIRVQGLQGEEFQGAVTRTATSLDPRARTLRTEIDLPNPEHKLLSGMFASVNILVEHTNAWTLPAAAIGTQGEQAACYRVVDGRAVRTPVRLGIRDDKRVEVLKRQTRAAKVGDGGEWVDFTGDEEIAQDAAGLADGQAVTVSVEKK
jgi:multidrug efflux pump subunit AcrA (membrane-fusion protein)